jgi:xanthine dehydrogenase accessory factor
MQDLYRMIADAVERGERVAMATIVRSHGSTPRDVGTKMVIYGDGRTVGTIGGGAMEARVIREAVGAIARGASELVHYALHDAEAGDPGICGGDADVFVDVVVPASTLLVVGGGHVAMPVAEIGHICGYRVVVLDDRPEMLTEGRFPHAHRAVGDIEEQLRSWPITPDTHIVIVTRGHAYDEVALRAVIDSPAAYIGMIGSRRKVRTVLDRLRADGVEERLLDRIRAPIGLEIGSETPAEIAVSILAEIIMLRRGGHGGPMKLE